MNYFDANKQQQFILNVKSTLSKTILILRRLNTEIKNSIY
jgi:hypothetical protein